MHDMNVWLEGRTCSVIWQGVIVEIQVDVDRLRECMLDEYGSAAFNGLPAAVMDA